MKKRVKNFIALLFTGIIGVFGLATKVYGTVKALKELYTELSTERGIY